MWLFRNEYKLQPSTRKTRGTTYESQVWEHLKKVSLFVTEVYVKYWFSSPSAAAAPRNDLQLLNALSNYPDKEVAAAAITAFNRHLWYLSEVLIGLAFFDKEVSIEEKKKMVEALRQTPGSDKPLKRIPPITDPAVKSLHDFVTMSTARFFKALDLSSCFLDYDPTEWCDQED